MATKSLDERLSVNGKSLDERLAKYIEKLGFDRNAILAIDGATDAAALIKILQDTGSKEPNPNKIEPDAENAGRKGEAYFMSLTGTLNDIAHSPALNAAARPVIDGWFSDTKPTQSELDEAIAGENDPERKKTLEGYKNQIDIHAKWFDDYRKRPEVIDTRVRRLTAEIWSLSSLLGNPNNTWDTVVGGKTLAQRHETLWKLQEDISATPGGLTGAHKDAMIVAYNRLTGLGDKSGPRRPPVLPTVDDLQPINDHIIRDIGKRAAQISEAAAKSGESGTNWSQGMKLELADLEQRAAALLRDIKFDGRVINNTQKIAAGILLQQVGGLHMWAHGQPLEINGVKIELSEGKTNHITEDDKKLLEHALSGNEGIFALDADIKTLSKAVKDGGGKWNADQLTQLKALNDRLEKYKKDAATYTQEQRYAMMAMNAHILQLWGGNDTTKDPVGGTPLEDGDRSAIEALRGNIPPVIAAQIEAERQAAEQESEKDPLNDDAPNVGATGPGTGGGGGARNRFNQEARRDKPMTEEELRRAERQDAARRDREAREAALGRRSAGELASDALAGVRNNVTSGADPNGWFSGVVNWLSDAFGSAAGGTRDAFNVRTPGADGFWNLVGSGVGGIGLALGLPTLGNWISNMIGLPWLGKIAALPLALYGLLKGLNVGDQAMNWYRGPSPLVGQTADGSHAVPRVGNRRIDSTVPRDGADSQRPVAPTPPSSLQPPTTLRAAAPPSESGIGTAPISSILPPAAPEQPPTVVAFANVHRLDGTVKKTVLTNNPDATQEINEFFRKAPGVAMGTGPNIPDAMLGNGAPELVESFPSLVKNTAGNIIAFPNRAAVPQPDASLASASTTSRKFVDIAAEAERVRNDLADNEYRAG